MAHFDLAGVPRGKMMPSTVPTTEIIRVCSTPGSARRSPATIRSCLGEFKHDPLDSDLKLMPDLTTLSVVPWETDPTAQIICDIVSISGKPITYTPRNLLRHVVGLYAAKGWTPVTAPEIEFYLVAQNIDPDYPLQTPKGRSGRSISGGQAY